MTQVHRFPVISAYDGHPAGVGRIAYNSTRHHFVNVNLIGVLEGGGFDKFGPLNPTESGTKDDGFVWIAPTAHHSCFNCWMSRSACRWGWAIELEPQSKRGILA